MIEGNSSPLTHILATVSKAATAGIGHLIPSRRASSFVHFLLNNT